MTAVSRKRVEAGISLYTRPLLFVYDSLLLGCGCRFLWSCPSRDMLELYNEYISANHLDIGVGSGYFMDKCRFPSTSPRIVLMDLNPNSLRAASKRLARFNPETYRRNVLEPFDLAIPPFDSIGMMNLLHCLPGDMKTKKVAFQNSLELLNPGGTVFGSTILYRGVRRSALATSILRITNRLGIMTNLDDEVEDLEKNLKDLFSECGVKITGCEALFWARK